MAAVAQIGRQFIGTIIGPTVISVVVFRRGRLFLTGKVLPLVSVPGRYTVARGSGRPATGTTGYGRVRGRIEAKFRETSMKARIVHFRRAATVLVAALTVAGSANAADTLKKIRNAGAITLGYRESSVPFSFLDTNRQPIGYSIDLCMKVVDAVRRELKMPKLAVKFTPVTPASRIPDLIAGKIDLECGSTTNNAERRKQVAFTISTYIAGAKYLTKAASKIKGLDDFAGKTVVTTQGTTTEKILRGLDTQNVMKMQILLAKDHAESFSYVVSGRALAFFMDDILLYGQRAESDAPQDYEVSTKLLSIEPLSLMLRRDDPAFKRMVDLEIARVIMDAEIYGLYRKWFQSPIPPKGINLNVPMNFLLRDSFVAPSDQLVN